VIHNNNNTNELVTVQFHAVFRFVSSVKSKPILHPIGISYIAHNITLYPVCHHSRLFHCLLVLPTPPHLASPASPQIRLVEEICLIGVAIIVESISTSIPNAGKVVVVVAVIHIKVIKVSVAAIKVRIVLIVKFIPRLLTI
jgi:hypothetical protein